MTIAIIGTGGVALATAALLHTKGYPVSLISLSGQGGQRLASGQVMATGAVQASVPVNLATSAASALELNDDIIIATSADRYVSALEAILPHIEDRSYD